jgi:hypothetical protein
MISRISWLDSTGQSSRIHATRDGVDTICGHHEEYIAERMLVKAPKKKHGWTNYCSVCFKNLNHTLPRDARCRDLEEGTDVHN